jgi:hypothetical protein
MEPLHFPPATAHSSFASSFVAALNAIALTGNGIENVIDQRRQLPLKDNDKADQHHQDQNDFHYAYAIFFLQKCTHFTHLLTPFPQH